MQDVGENMDDLFRKAADNYMLKEGENNWTEISGQLQSSIAPVAVKEKNNTAKKYIISGLLLLILLMAGILLNQYNPKNNTAVIATTQYIDSNPNNKKGTGNLTVSANNQVPQKKGAPEQPSRKDESTPIKNTDTGSEKFYRTQIKSYPISNTSISKNNHYPVGVNPATPDLDTEVVKDETANTPINIREPQMVLHNNITPVEQSDLNKESKKNTPLTVSPGIKSKKGIYYGLLAGAGFTTIKHQGLSKPGFDLGLAAGYHFTTRSAVEINALYSHKYYYTDGKYFDMGKMSDMPAGMKFMSIKGKAAFLKYRLNLNTLYYKKARALSMPRQAYRLMYW